MHTLDYLIIGQGIAGSVLAYQLLEADKKILVIDHPNPNSSSKVAAGIINPVTGRRIVKSWKIDDLLPTALAFYQKIEKLKNTRLLTHKNILRIFENQREQNDFLAKTAEPSYLDYLKEWNQDLDYIQAELGAGIIEKVYYLNTPKFLQTIQEILIEKNSFLSVKFNYEEIKINENSIEWKGYQAKKIIFCEGIKMLQNPYFNYLPIRPAKGETLKIKAPNLPSDYLLKKSILIAPSYEEDTFWIGATFDRKNINEEVSEEGLKYLKEKLEKAIKVPYTISQKQAGIRPTVKDRRPLVGIHPDYPSLCLFNGMGSKGVSLVPYCAENLINHLHHNHPLDQEININRYPPKV